MLATLFLRFPVCSGSINPRNHRSNSPETVTRLLFRVQTTIEKEHILNKLMTQSRVATTRGAGTLTGGVTESERLEAIAKLRDIPEWSVEQYLDNLYELSLPVDEDVVSSFTDRITDLVTQVCIMF